MGSRARYVVKIVYSSSFTYPIYRNTKDSVGPPGDVVAKKVKYVAPEKI